MRGLLSSVYDRDFLARLRPAVSDSHRHLCRILVDVDDWSLAQQRKLEQLLCLAAAHSQLDENTVKRLRSPDPATFWGKLNEFVVAELFKSAGASLNFSPPGRGTREGEFVADLDGRIFVEVKTMFPGPTDANESRHLNRLCQTASKVDYPAWVMIQILRVPNSDPALAPFRAFLEAKLPDLANAPQGQRSAVYEDEGCGLQAAVAYQTDLQSGPVEVSPFSGMKVLTEDESVKASLKKAYRQLPDDMPCLVVLSSRLQFPPSPRLIRDALYGKTQWMVRLTDLRGQDRALPAQVTRRDDGFFAKGQNSRVSGVAVVDELREKYNLDPQLVVHYHPSPRHPLVPQALAGVTKRQEMAERVETSGGVGLRLWHPFDPPWPSWDRDDSN